MWQQRNKRTTKPTLTNSLKKDVAKRIERRVKVLRIVYVGKREYIQYEKIGAKCYI